MSQIATKFIKDLAVSTAKLAASSVTDAKVATGIDAIKIADGSVTNAEFQFINTLTSNAQTQLNGKASTTLNNLGTTSINADLLPSADSTRSLGSDTLMWSAGYINELFDTAGQNAVDVNGRKMYDTAALESVNAAARTLSDNSAGNVAALDYSSGTKIAILPTDGAAARAIELQNGAGTFGVSIKAPALSASYTLTLPVDDGTSNQVLQTDGSGVLSWATVAAGESRNKATFVLVAGDITNQYIDLSHVAATNSIHLIVKDGAPTLEGASYDYTVSYTGGAGGNTRISFANDLATGGAAALVATDVLQVVYEH
jgi:hypothetical protein